VVDAIQVEGQDDKTIKRKLNSVEGEAGLSGVVQEDDMVGATRWQKAAAKKKKLLEAQAIQEGQRLLAEDQAIELKEKAENMVQQPNEKPLSRAERRKKIKEQILAEGEGEGFKGYKRRMW